MTMYSVIHAVQVFLRILSLATFIYWIMTFLRFNNRFVEILASSFTRSCAPFAARRCG